MKTSCEDESNSCFAVNENFLVSRVRVINARFPEEFNRNVKKS